MANAEDGNSVCWVCLQDTGHLVYPCACPRAVHEACLAKWQLHCCGREEELCCRFCRQPLPHWRQAFQHRCAAPASSDACNVTPLMSIQFHGQTYWLQVHTGEGGVAQFRADVKRLLGLDAQDDFDITFELQVPGEDSKLELHGLQAYDAAVYCASLTAAERRAGTTSSAGVMPAASSSCAEPAPAGGSDGSGSSSWAGHTRPGGADSAAAGELECSASYSHGRTAHASSSGGSSHQAANSSHGSISDSMEMHRVPSVATSYGTAIEDAWPGCEPDCAVGVDGSSSGGGSSAARRVKGVWAVACRAWGKATRKLSQ